jgi:hypothetical protein
MTTKSNIVIGGILSACLVSAGLWCYSYYSRRLKVNGPASKQAVMEAKPQSDEATLVAKVDRLTNAVAALTDRINEIEGNKARPGSKRESDVKKAALLRPSDPVEDRARAVRRLTGITEVFEREGRDGVWANAMESTLRRAFDSGHYDGSMVLAITCQTSTCKMEVQHEDPASSHGFERIVRDVPGNFYMQHLDSDQTGGKPQTIAFFVRKGREANSALARAMSAFKEQRP